MVVSLLIQIDLDGLWRASGDEQFRSSFCKKKRQFIIYKTVEISLSDAAIKLYGHT